ncbi:9179_t:CDS:1, partial [Funneliformis geosporum]
ICNYCITKYGDIRAVQIKPEYYTVNHARLCRNHLAKYPNFCEYVDDEEVQKILALSVLEDKKN